jgi:aldose 1-epimerase
VTTQNQHADHTGKESGQFHSEVIQDEGLSSTVIILSYTDLLHPEHNLSVKIAPEFGSNLFSYRAGDYDLIYCDYELLKQRAFTGNFVLWPLPNRIRDQKYTYQGQEYSLAKVSRLADQPTLIHGLVYDLGWHYQQPVVSQDKAQVTTFIDISPEHPYYEAYPFDSRLSLTYTLTSQGISVSYTVHNKGQHTLPFGFGLHPYFALLSDKEETTVSIPAETVMEADNILLPTTRLLDVRSEMYKMFDLREPRPIGALQLDHVYTDLTPGASAVISYRKQHMRLSLSATSDFTHMVIYTPPTGEPFFCLENQTCSTDAINLHARGLDQMSHLLEVPVGEEVSGTIYYTVDFDKAS